ncbi:MAG: hypothetical protein IIC49_03280 [Planctomycetes bacterium]|nr:hypothetical protein [Planctomycetota bacterium]
MSGLPDAHTQRFKPDMPEVVMHLHMPANPAVGVVVSNEKCTAGKAAAFIRHIAIDVSGTQLAGNLRPGQSFGVLAPGTDERSRPHKVRLYSVASPTGGEGEKRHVIATTVKRLIAEHRDRPGLFLGVTSNLLCDLRPGDEIRLTGPNGKRFLVPRNAGEHDYVFFATGTGIAPYRGMVHDLLEAGVQSRIVLVMGSPYRTDLLYDEHFRSLEREHPGFLYVPTLSRERQQDGQQPMYVRDRLGRVASDLASSFSSGRALVYICGVAGMELGIFEEMALRLSPADLGGYLEIDPEAMGRIGRWERRMIHRAVRPTRRIFMEVY